MKIVLCPKLTKHLERIEELLFGIYVAVTPRVTEVKVLINGEEKEQPMVVGTKFSVTFQALDAQKRPAKYDGTPVWSMTPDGVVSLTVASDGKSATGEALPIADPAATEAVVAIMVKVDADLRPDSELDIIGTASVPVTNGPATTVQLTVTETP